MRSEAIDADQFFAGAIFVRIERAHKAIASALTRLPGRKVHRADGRLKRSWPVFLRRCAPGFQTCAEGALALATLVDGDRGVVRDLQERNDALVLAVGAPDARRGHALASSHYRMRK